MTRFRMSQTKAVLDGDAGSLGAGRDVKLGVNGDQVRTDCLRAEKQAIRDLAVRQALCHLPQYLQLAWGQVGEFRSDLLVSNDFRIRRFLMTVSAPRSRTSPA